MLARWLITVFPREMRRGWRLVWADATFWVVLSVLLALVALIPAPRVAPAAELEDSELTLLVTGALVRLLLFPVVVTIASVRFAAHGGRHEAPWSAAAKAVVRRSPPTLAAWTLARALSACLAVAAAQAATMLLVQLGQDDPEVVSTVAAIVGYGVVLGSLVVFAFVPFLTVLERRDRLGVVGAELSSVGRLAWPVAWPLIASSRLTRSVRWRIVPYLALAIYAPAAAGGVPNALQPPLSFVLQLVAFTALAVLFEHHADRLDRLRHGSASPA